MGPLSGNVTSSGRAGSSGADFTTCLTLLLLLLLLPLLPLPAGVGGGALTAAAELPDSWGG